MVSIILNSDELSLPCFISSDRLGLLYVPDFFL